MDSGCIWHKEARNGNVNAYACMNDVAGLVLNA
jgi:hypothetical protein